MLHPNAPLLPAWATDAQIEDAADTLYFEYVLYVKMINRAVEDNAPDLINEAEALLKHEAEGW